MNFFTGTLILSLSSLLVSFLNYVVNISISRFLGPGPYSELMALFAYLTVLSAPIAMLSPFLIQKITASDDSRATLSTTVHSFWHLTRRLSLFILLGAIVGIPLFSRITNLTLVSSGTLFVLLLSSFLLAPYANGLLALKLFSLSAVVQAVSPILKLLGILLGVFVLHSLLPVYGGIVLSTIGAIIAAHLVLFGRGGTSSPSNHSVKSQLRRLTRDPFFLISFVSTLSFLILNNGDIMFVKRIYASVPAASYAGWSLFGKMIYFLAAPVCSSAYIFFASPDKSHKAKQSLLAVGIVLSIVMTACSYYGYLYLGGWLDGLLFAHKFTAIVGYLPLAGLFGSLYSANFFINGYFLARKSRFALLSAGACVVYSILVVAFGGSSIGAIMQVNIGCSLLLFVASLFGVWRLH